MNSSNSHDADADEGWDDDADFLAAASAATDQAAANTINRREQNSGKLSFESSESSRSIPGKNGQQQQQQQQQQQRPPSMSLRDSGCERCGILSIDNEILDVFGVRTCFACKAADVGLKLITKSKTKEEFLLNDSQLSSLGSVRKENPRKPGKIFDTYLQEAV